MARANRKPPPPLPPVVSALCADGQHDQCIGTAYVWPPVRGRTIVACECRRCRHRPRL